ncbi:MAG: RDD family protein [Anaerolineae bacterium]|nr:RDD family protein [Anaerolineae bacterium]
MTLSVGQFVQNRYRIEALLGQGGFGAVYRALDLNINYVVALKENLDASPEAERQFAREAALLVRLRHPSLPRVTDTFVVPGQGRYLVMDFVEGQDLQDMLDRYGSLDEARAMAWMSQVLDALAYLHSQNPPIIHRDVKPANIRVTPDGRAVLVDFGIAKLYDPRLLTTSGARAVTPGYSPWEQYGHGGTDARSDVYAAGATLYALLTGQVPPESLALMGGTERAVAPRAINPRLSPNVEAIIQRAMTTQPTGRYQDAGQMRQALAARPQQQPGVQPPAWQANVTLGSSTPARQPPVARPQVAAPAVAHPAPGSVAAGLPVGMEVADLGSRFVAFLVDGVLSTVIATLASIPCWIVAVLLSEEISSDADTFLLLGIAAVGTLAACWYRVHFHAKTGQTPGKRWLHIKVVGEDGKPISRKRALVRVLFFWILPGLASAFTFGLSCLIWIMPLFGAKHLGLHDVVAKTLVVKAQPEP